jgi:hypothetical protein
MPRDFHESYVGAEIKPPSERSTGLVFGAVAAIVAVRWHTSSMVLWLALGSALVLVTVSLIAPVLFRPLSIVWFQFGLLLYRIVNPLVMLAMFALVFVPAGVLMRIWRDPLRLRRMTGASSYWIDRSESEDNRVSMTNQF